ncbi:hypothetical protein [Streptomyces sp. NPDC003635]
MDRPSWLRPGPRSPNLENSADPESVYDSLGARPQNCSAALDVIRAEADEPQWQVLRGLAEACLAVQGQNGNWDDAAKYFAATEGRLATCKGLAARAVLGDVLRFHQEHPSATVRLRSSENGGGAEACDFRITKVVPDEDGVVEPGDRITIEVSGAHFSSEDLPSMSAFVKIGGKESQDGPQLVPGSESDGRFSFTVGVPTFASYPQTVGVTIEYGDTAGLDDAITLVGPTGSSPDVSPSPVTSPSP